MISVPITDAQGNTVAIIEVPDNTSAERIEQLKVLYAPKTPSMYDIVNDKLESYQKLAPKLLRDLYVKNTLSGMSVVQSNALFEEFSDVILRLSQGAFPTALYCLSLKTATAHAPQEKIDEWKKTIQDYMA